MPLHLYCKAPAPQSRMLVVAALTLLAFGCATVRAPVADFDDRIPAQSKSIDGMLEFDLESSDAIPDAEQQRAAEDARRSLANVIDAHSIWSHALGATDAFLIVRERGVARTSSRKTNQTVAVAALIVGAALVVVALVLGAKGSGGGSASAAEHVGSLHHAGHAASFLPHGVGHAVSPQLASASRAPIAAAVARAPGMRAAAPMSRPAPGHPTLGYTDAHFGRSRREEPVYVAPIDPLLSLELELELASAVDNDRPAAEELAEETAPKSDPLPAAGQDPQPPEPEIALPEMPQLLLTDRGYFSGDDTLLMLDLVDRETGAVLWTRRSEASIDARNPDDLNELFEKALKGQSWVRARE